MKLSDYAKYLGIAYHTAWKHYKNGLIPYPTRQLPDGAVLKVDFNPKNQFGQKTFNKAAIYTRVSLRKNRSNLDSQADRLCRYSRITHVIKSLFM